MKNRQWATLEAKGFDLAKTLECGQCFRWKRNKEGGFTGVVNNKVIHALQQGDRLLLRSISEEEDVRFWQVYFDLDRDYDAIERRILARAPWMKRAAALGRGIRILAQDPWETTITFILSANNHIPRITASVDCLSRHYGAYLEQLEGEVYHGFPTPRALSQVGEEGWKACGAGYRWSYLAATAAWWESSWKTLEKMDPAGGADPLLHRKVLEQLPGVGPKVSACISLYGLGHHHQFPVDVWIRRRVKALWPEAPGTDRGIEEEARALFGDAAGYAQQLLFYEARVDKAFNKKGG